jgi:hypothetical protein
VGGLQHNDQEPTTATIRDDILDKCKHIFRNHQSSWSSRLCRGRISRPCTVSDLALNKPWEGAYRRPARQLGQHNVFDAELLVSSRTPLGSLLRGPSLS